MKVRIKFRKYGVMKFIGHLDVMRYFQKVMRRGEIPIAFTKGFSPHMIMSFAQPLGLGVTSDGEYFDIELKEAIDSQKALQQMNAVMAEGMEVISFLQIPEEKKYSGMTMVAAATYRLTLSQSFAHLEEQKKFPAEWVEKSKAFLEQPEIVILKKTKRSEKETDIKPMIFDFQMTEDKLELFLATGSEQNLKPDLVMKAFLRFVGAKEEEVPFHVHRYDVYAKAEDFEKSHKYLPLEAFGKQIIVADAEKKL